MELDDENIQAQKNKLDENFQGDPHVFPRSLRCIKAMWTNKEEKNILSAEAHLNDRTSTETKLKEGNNNDINSNKREIGNANTNSLEKSSTIRLDKISDKEAISNIEIPTQQKTKKRNAFKTIRSYLEKNDSKEMLDKQEKNMIREMNNLHTSCGNILDGNSVSENAKNIDDQCIPKFDHSKALVTLFDEDGIKEVTTADAIHNQLSSNLNNLDTEAISDVITISKIGRSSTINNPLKPVLTYGNQTKMVSLFVGDLCATITETDLYLFFSGYEGLISVKIPMDTMKLVPLGYGYVNFDTQEHADVATEGLNYTKLGDSEIRIMPSLRDKLQRESIGANLFFSNLSSKLSSRILYDRFKVFGKVLSCKYSSEKQTCFINFSEKLSAYKICKQFNQSQMDNRLISVSVHIAKREREVYNSKLKPDFFNNNSPNTFSYKLDKISKSFKSTTLTQDIPNFGKPPSTQYSIFMKNIPLPLSDNAVRSLIEPYGTVKNVLLRKVPVKDGAWALVTMTNQEAVEKSIQALNAIEIEGKKVYVTRAIPREEKDYAKWESKAPSKKLKLLISDLDLEKHKEALEKWCSNCDSIKSAEFFSNSQKGEVPVNQRLGGYGYIELNNDDDADKVIEKLSLLKVSCYRIRIDIPQEDTVPNIKRYPYISNPSKSMLSSNYKPNVVSFSYVNPSNMFQIAYFRDTVNHDKMAYYRHRENHNKTKLKERYSVNESCVEKLTEKKIEMYHVMWEICVRLIISKEPFWDGSVFTPGNEILSKSRVSSLTDHLIKFFWNNHFSEFYNFVRENQFDAGNNVIHVANPILMYQIIESAKYLGIIPK